MTQFMLAHPYIFAILVIFTLMAVSSVANNALEARAADRAYKAVKLYREGSDDDDT